MRMSDDEFRKKFLTKLDRIDKSLQNLASVISKIGNDNGDVVGIAAPGYSANKNSRCSNCVYGKPLQSNCAKCFDGEYYTPAFDMEDDLK